MTKLSQVVARNSGYRVQQGSGIKTISYRRDHHTSGLHAIECDHPLPQTPQQKRTPGSKCWKCGGFGYVVRLDVPPNRSPEYLIVRIGKLCGVFKMKTKMLVGPPMPLEEACKYVEEHSTPEETKMGRKRIN